MGDIIISLPRVNYRISIPRVQDNLFHLSHKNCRFSWKLFSGLSVDPSLSGGLDTSPGSNLPKNVKGCHFQVSNITNATQKRKFVNYKL